MMRQKGIKALKAAFPYTIPILTGYIFLGMAFGVLLTSKGYSYIWAIGMSILIYAGSMQFVAIDILISPFNIINTIIITLLVNARHLFYGLSLLEKYDGMGKKKPYMIFSLTDETFSLQTAITSPKDIDEKSFRFFISLLNHLYWITGCTLGALIGENIKFNSEGIDFVMTALFVVIFIEQWQSTKNHKPALIGVFATLLCLIIFGESNFVLAAMILILLVLIIFKKVLIGEKK